MTRHGYGIQATIAAGLTLLLGVSTAGASDLSYTYIDFQALDDNVNAGGSQMPVPGQIVTIQTGSGSGIAVGGSAAIGQRFFISGIYKSSIADVTGTVESPLTTVGVDDEFDLTLGRLSFGYVLPIGDSLDLTAEVSYDSGTYDFGSFAGENFDVDDSGVGFHVGFRWNPRPELELFAIGRHSPVANTNLETREFESGTIIHAGVRWYFFQDLGLGLEYESGEVERLAISMRFSFGDLR
jgi:hypothetical protein